MRSLQRSRALLPTKANPPRKARGKMKRITMVRIGRQEEDPRYNEDTTTEELMRVSIYIFLFTVYLFALSSVLTDFLSVTQRSDAGALRLKSSSHSTRVLLCLVLLGIASTSAGCASNVQTNALPQGTDKKEKSSTHLAECSTQGGYYQQRTRLLGSGVWGKSLAAPRAYSNSEFHPNGRVH